MILKKLCEILSVAAWILLMITISPYNGLALLVRTLRPSVPTFLGGICVYSCATTLGSEGSRTLPYNYRYQKK